MIINPKWFKKMPMKPGAIGVFFQPSGWQGYAYIFSILIVLFLLLSSSIVIGVTGFVLAILWIIFTFVDILLMFSKRKK